MKLLHKLVAMLLGRNLKSTPTEVIKDQLLEPRPLPMGREEFEEWSTRIINGAMIPGEDGKYASCCYKKFVFIPEDHNDLPEFSKANIFEESQKYALANLIMHLGPTESHKPDAFFIHSLRKFAVNQVADAIRRELHDKAKERTAEEELAKLEAEDKRKAEEAA